MTTGAVKWGALREVKCKQCKGCIHQRLVAGYGLRCPSLTLWEAYIGHSVLKHAHISEPYPPFHVAQPPVAML